LGVDLFVNERGSAVLLVVLRLLELVRIITWERSAIELNLLCLFLNTVGSVSMILIPEIKNLQFWALRFSQRSIVSLDSRLTSQ
jgi:hypothetical protein